MPIGRGVRQKLRRNNYTTSSEHPGFPFRGRKGLTNHKKRVNFCKLFQKSLSINITLLISYKALIAQKSPFFKSVNSVLTIDFQTYNHITYPPVAIFDRLHF